MWECVGKDIKLRGLSFGSHDKLSANLELPGGNTAEFPTPDVL